jgi:hypothetical protein
MALLRSFSRLAPLAAVGLLALWACAGFGQTGEAPDDEAALDARLTALRSKVCANDAQLCQDLKAFTGANTPCLPQGERLAVGHARIIDDEGGVTPAEYFVVRAQRVRDVTLLQHQHVYSENEAEKQAAEALILGLRAGAVEPDNLLYRYLEAQREQVPELMAQKESRALVVRSEGPALYLRQAGKLLFAALPGGRFAAPGVEQGRAGVLFATLPAPASCQ